MRRLVTDALRYLPSQVLPALAGFVALPFITRASTPEAFGEYAVALASMNLLLVCALWVGHAVVRLEPATRTDGPDGDFARATVLATLITVVVLGCTSALALLAARPLLGAELVSTLASAVVAFAVKAFSDNLTQLLRAQGQSTAYSVLRSAEAITAAVLGVGLLYLSGSVGGIFWGAAVASGLILAPAWVLATGRRASRSGTRDVGSLMRAMARFGLPLTAAGVATWTLALSDRYLVAALASAEEAGLYSLGYSFAQKPLLLLATAFLLAYRPIGVELYEAKGERAAARFLEDASRLFLLVAVPAVVWLAVAARPLVEALSGPAYRDAAAVMPIVALGMLLFGVTNFYQEGLGYAHRTRRILAATSIAAVTNVVLNVALIPRFGMGAAAWDTLAAFAVLLALTAVWSRRELAWRFPIRTAAGTAAAGLAGAAAGLLVVSALDAPWVACAVSACAVLAVYTLALLALGEISRRSVARALAPASAEPGEAL